MDANTPAAPAPLLRVLIEVHPHPDGDHMRALDVNLWFNSPAEANDAAANAHDISVACGEVVLATFGATPEEVA